MCPVLSPVIYVRQHHDKESAHITKNWRDYVFDFSRDIALGVFLIIHKMVILVNTRKKYAAHMEFLLKTYDMLKVYTWHLRLTYYFKYIDQALSRFFF